MGTTPEQMLIGLDVGTTKIALLVVARDAEGHLRYVEGTRVESAGVRNGVIINIAEATHAIERAVYTVEERYGRRITGACVAVSGRHLTSQNLRGQAIIAPVGREIGHEDVTRAIAAAREGLQVKENQEILHEIPRAYVVDGQPGIQDPYGMAGYDLQVEVHYTTGTATILQNLLKCVRGARVLPLMVVAAPLAAGEAVRDAYDEARSLAVVEVGAETTNFALYVNGAVWMSEVLPVGGATITEAISTQLKLPFSAAEELKLQHGHCDPREVGEFELVEVPAAAGIDATLPRSELVRIISEQAEALADDYGRWLDDARRAGVEPEVVVLTGGSAGLAGFDTLLTRVLDVPVRRGAPEGIRGLPPVLDGPAFANVAGLVLWSAHYSAGDAARRSPKLHAVPGIGAVWERIARVVMP